MERIKTSEMSAPMRNFMESKIKNKEIIFKRYEEAGKNMQKDFLFQ